MSFGTISIDEELVPIERMWLDGGRLWFRARWYPRKVMRSGGYDLIVYCPDGSLYVRHYEQHMHIPPHEVGDEVCLQFSLIQADGVTEQARERMVAR